MNVTGNTTWSPTANTTSSDDDSKPYPVYAGYICALIAVLMYGSSYVPVKKFKTGDGMFFQWVLCNGIFLVGIVIQLIQQGEFYSLVMVGGALWATGNICTIPIFKTIGLGLGMCTWSISCLVMGWAAGKFGLFNTKADVISNHAMNYAGVALAFGSIILYVLIKNEVSDAAPSEIVVHEGDRHNSTLSSSLNHDSAVDSKDSVIVFKRLNESTKSKSSSSDSVEMDDPMFIEKLSPIKKRIVGTCLAVFAGIMYGLMFTPCTYVQDNYENVSQNGLDYVFAQFCGIYAASSIYFFIYCAIKKNKPQVYPKVVLPGIISGVMWAIATSSWFIANAEISEAVTYPIIGTAPAGISSLFWGVFVFHEIKGLRNILILLAAFSVMAAGVILAGLSK